MAARRTALALLAADPRSRVDLRCGTAADDAAHVTMLEDDVRATNLRLGRRR